LKLTTLLRKACPVERSAYDDFPAEMENDISVLAAAQWNSSERILGHCFRAFLNASHGHTSNCLVDVRGRLWEIDFERVLFREDDHADIAELRFLVEGSASIMAACKQICQITSADIEAALMDIPSRFWQGDAVITRPELAWLYFTNRLESWKLVFGQ